LDAASTAVSNRAKTTALPAGLVVFLAATLPHLWTLKLEFAHDDYTVVASAPFVLGATRVAPRPFAASADPEIAAPKESTAALARQSYLHRPAASAWWCALVELGGGVAKRTIFRTAALLVHGLNAWLLFRFLKRFLPSAAAATGAAWFGFAASAHQAITWVAATGDLLATTLTLAGLALACASAARAGLLGALGTAAAGLLTGLSFAAKESAPPLMAVAFLAFLATARPTFGRASLALATGAFVVLLTTASRYFHLGDPIPRYPIERPFDLDVVLRLPALLGQMAVPYNRAAAFQGLEPIAIEAARAFGAADATTFARLLAAGCAAPVVLGTFVVGARRFAGFLGALVATGVLLLPASWMTFRDGGDYVYSRNVYQAAPALAAVLAFGVAGWSRRGAATLALVSAPLALLAADGVVHAARVERSAADAIRTRLDSLEAIVAAEPSGTRIVAVDPLDGIDGAGVPLVGVGYPWAFSPIFGRGPAPVDRRYAFDDDVAADYARSEPRRVVFARVADDGAFERFGPEFPARPDGPVELVRSEGAPRRFAPSRPTPARFVAALRAACRSSGGAVGVRWTYEPSEGGEPTHKSGGLYFPEDGGPAYAAAPSSPDVARMRLVSAEFEGVDVEGAPEVLEALPKIEIVEGVGAGRGGVLRVGTAPSLSFRRAVPASEYRVTFRFDMGAFAPTIVYVVREERVRAGEDGVARWTATSEDAAVTPPEFGEHGRFESMTPLWNAYASTLGLVGVTGRYRVEGIGAGAPISRSAWGYFRLVGPSDS
jgi:hypothetical protein